MTASFHVAEAIGEEIVTRLAKCTVAQGAETDLGTTVFRGRRMVSDDMIPCVSLIESDDIPARGPAPGAMVKLNQRYVMMAYVTCDADNPNIAAHAALRDMKRALFTNSGDFRLEGKVYRCAYLGREIAPRADGAKFVIAAIEIGIDYVEDLSAP